MESCEPTLHFEGAPFEVFALAFELVVVLAYNRDDRESSCTLALAVSKVEGTHTAQPSGTRPS